MTQRFFVLLSAILISTTGYGQGLKGTTYAEAQQSRSGTLVCTYVTTPGFVEPSHEGEKGLSVGLMDAFIEWVKREKHIVLTKEIRVIGDPSDFTNFMGNIRSSKGGVFGLGNITITDTRKKEFNMSDPFLPNVSIMVTHNSVPTLNSLDDLPRTFAGFTCYVVKGTTNAERMYDLKKNRFPSLNIVEVASSEETLERVSQDPKSFTNLDFTYYIAIFKRGLPLKRHPAGDNSDEDLGVIMPKSNDWAPVFNEFLNSGYLQSPEYRTLLAKNLHRDIINILDAM